MLGLRSVEGEPTDKYYSVPNRPNRPDREGRLVCLDPPDYGLVWSELIQTSTPWSRPSRRSEWSDYLIKNYIWLD